MSKEGLERRGLAFESIHDGKLFLVVYTGTGEHYFEKHRQEVEKKAPSCQGVTPFLVLRTITCSTFPLNILKYRSF